MSWLDRMTNCMLQLLTLVVTKCYFVHSEKMLFQLIVLQLKWRSSDMSTVACRGLVMPGANDWLNAPLPNSSIEECEIQRQQTTCPDLFHVQKDYATKTSSQLRIKKRKKLHKSRTTSRNNRKRLERCKQSWQTEEKPRKALKISDLGFCSQNAFLDFWFFLRKSWSF